MEHYNAKLKEYARTLRASMTDAEQLLWHHIRRKQMQGKQFYRQKPLLDFIVDFYCPAAKLVIEIDGSQHFEAGHQTKDLARDSALKGLGLQVLRFNNLQILLETQAVLEAIDKAVSESDSKINSKSPSIPLFQRGKTGNESSINELCIKHQIKPI